MLIPHSYIEWYGHIVSGTYNITVGDRGRLVLPAELRTRTGLTEGVPLIALETDGGIVLMTRAQLLRRVRDEFAGVDLVDELLAERRQAAVKEQRT